MWNLWKNSFLQGLGKPKEIWREFMLSQIFHEHSLPSPLSAPQCSCPGCCCSPHLLFQQLPTFCKYAFVFWLHQPRGPADKQAGTGTSGTVIVRTDKICRAKGTWGTREEDWSESCRSHNESWEILAARAGEFEGPEEAREPKGSLVRSEVSFESVSSVCMLLEGRRVSLPESHVALQDSWIQPRIHG